MESCTFWLEKKDQVLQKYLSKSEGNDFMRETAVVLQYL